MPTAAENELEQSVVKLQLRVATLERYTDELVAAVDAMLTTHAPDPPQAPRDRGKTEEDAKERQQRMDETRNEAITALEYRVDSLQDTLVQRLQDYVDTRIESVRAQHSRMATSQTALEAEAVVSPATPSSSPPLSISALAHDLTACVNQIEALMDNQQQQREDMEICMALLLRLEKKQDALTSQAPHIPADRPPAGHDWPVPCRGCQALHARVGELEELVRGLCSERSARAREAEATSILSAAAHAQQSGPAVPGTTPLCGTEAALWRCLSTLSSEVAAHGALLGQQSAAREISPLPAFLAQPPPAPTGTKASAPREIKIEDTPQALRAFEARARDVQSSISALS